LHWNRWKTRGFLLCPNPPGEPAVASRDADRPRLSPTQSRTDDGASDFVEDGAPASATESVPSRETRRAAEADAGPKTRSLGLPSDCSLPSCDDESIPVACPHNRATAYPSPTSQWSCGQRKRWHTTPLVSAWNTLANRFPPPGVAIVRLRSANVPWAGWWSMRVADGYKAASLWSRVGCQPRVSCFLNPLMAECSTPRMSLRMEDLYVAFDTADLLAAHPHPGCGTPFPDRNWAHSPVFLTSFRTSPSCPLAAIGEAEP